VASGEGRIRCSNCTAVNLASQPFPCIQMHPPYSFRGMPRRSSVCSSLTEKTSDILGFGPGNRENVNRRYRNAFNIWRRDRGSSLKPSTRTASQSRMWLSKWAGRRAGCTRRLPAFVINSRSASEQSSVSWRCRSWQAKSEIPGSSTDTAPATCPRRGDRNRARSGDRVRRGDEDRECR
jgi:hypothetical protein